MNTFIFTQRRFSARLFAVLTIVSLLLSAFPAAFFVAEAAPNLLSESNVVVDRNTPYESSSVDVSGLTNLQLSLNYDAESLDAGDKFKFGWRDSDGEHAIDTINGKKEGSIGDESDSDVFPISASAGITSITIFAEVTANSDSDQAVLITLTLTGDEATVEEEKKVVEERKIDICHWNGNFYIPQNVNINSLGNGHGNNGVNQGDIIPPVETLFPAGFNWDWGQSWFNNNCSEPVTDPVFGCMDPEAINYNENATEAGDVICEYSNPEQCVNLLENGSFETPVVANTSLWQKFANVAGWMIEKVSDNSSTTLELHRDWSSNEAADGAQYAELDGDHSTKVKQSVTTLPGGLYKLSWAFAPRHNITALQNQLAVSVEGSVVAVEGPVTGSAGLDSNDWTRSSYSFTAADNSTEIQFADAGPSDSYGTFLDDARLCLVREPVQSVTVNASKIVCTDESDLPNWNTDQNGAPTITANTASDWITGHESCSIVKGWEFEWAPKGTSDPGDTLVGSAGAGWTTFSGSTQVPVSAFSGDGYFWMREVLQANYIPFTHEAEGNKNTDDVTAEFYCHTDGLNYDNQDRVDNPQTGGEYYCVAWNVAVPQEPETYRIDGHKFGLDIDAISFLSGWTINLLDSEDTVVMSTTTDSSGYYYFDVVEGYYEVHEVMQTDWNQVSVKQNGDLVDGEYCSFEVGKPMVYARTSEFIQEENNYSCDFTNEYVGEGEPEVILGCTDSSALNYNEEATLGNEEAQSSCIYEEVTRRGGSSSGGRPRITTPTPLVLGASTSFCPFINDHMQMGWNNDSFEVMKLQLFLNIFKNVYGGVENPVTGFFGATTDANVKAFQEKYHEDIISPWFEKGIVPHHEPTGFVYKTTLWKINSIVCPDYAVLPNFEGEDLTTNVALHRSGVRD